MRAEILLVDNSVTSQTQGHDAGILIVSRAGKDRESPLRGRDTEGVSMRHHFPAGRGTVEDAFCKLVEAPQRAGRLAFADFPVEAILLTRSAHNRVGVLVVALVVELLGVRNQPACIDGGEFIASDPPCAQFLIRGGSVKIPS